MKKNIIVLVKLLEHGEVSANDFIGLEKGNVRHLPRIIHDARQHLKILTEKIVQNPTMESLGVKYIVETGQEELLRKLIARKIDFQLKKKKIKQIEHAYLIKRITPW